MYHDYGFSGQQKACIGGSAGQIPPGITARVERSDRTLADFDEPGELIVKTPSLSLGYAGNPEATVETFVNGRLSMVTVLYPI